MSNRLRVLYVDDEVDIRSIVEFALEDESDLELSLCGSGTEALERIGSFRPDLILLDVMMPGMDGPTTLQRLRAIPGQERTPVAFVTAKVQPKEVEYFHGLGAVGVIAKPFDLMALAEQLRDIRERSRNAA